MFKSIGFLLLLFSLLCLPAVPCRCCYPWKCIDSCFCIFQCQCGCCFLHLHPKPGLILGCSNWRETCTTTTIISISIVAAAAVELDNFYLFLGWTPPSASKLDASKLDTTSAAQATTDAGSLFIYQGVKEHNDIRNTRNNKNIIRHHGESNTIILCAKYYCDA